MNVDGRDRRADLDRLADDIVGGLGDGELYLEMNPLVTLMRLGMTATEWADATKEERDAWVGYANWLAHDAGTHAAGRWWAFRAAERAQQSTGDQS